MDIVTKAALKEYGMKVTQANSTELVVITYELASGYIEEAEKNINDVTEFRTCIKKARAFIGELISALNMDCAISGELMRIYLFINRELQIADIRLDITEFPRLRGILDKLKKSFEDIVQMDKKGPVMRNTQQVYAGLTYSKGSLNENMYTDNAVRGYTV
jgi:flagellar protein FliS